MRQVSVFVLFYCKRNQCERKIVRDRTGASVYFYFIHQEHKNPGKELKNYVNAAKPGGWSQYIYILYSAFPIHRTIDEMLPATFFRCGSRPVVVAHPLNKRSPPIVGPSSPSAEVNHPGESVHSSMNIKSIHPRQQNSPCRAF